MHKMNEWTRVLHGKPGPAQERSPEGARSRMVGCRSKGRHDELSARAQFNEIVVELVARSWAHVVSGRNVAGLLR